MNLEYELKVQIYKTIGDYRNHEAVNNVGLLRRPVRSLMLLSLNLPPSGLNAYPELGRWVDLSNGI